MIHLVDARGLHQDPETENQEKVPRQFKFGSKTRFVSSNIVYAEIESVNKRSEGIDEIPLLLVVFLLVLAAFSLLGFTVN